MSPLSLPTRRATIALARSLAKAMRAGDLLLLEGELGAGKTFLARALLRALGVPYDERVGSPTFALVHEYDTGDLRLVHADLYRLTGQESVRELGLWEARAEGALLVVEWGSRFADELGADGLFVRLELVEGGRRAVALPRGTRGEELARTARLVQG